MVFRRDQFSTTSYPRRRKRRCSRNRLHMCSGAQRKASDTWPQRGFWPIGQKDRLQPALGNEILGSQSTESPGDVESRPYLVEGQRRKSVYGRALDQGGGIGEQVVGQTDVVEITGSIGDGEVMALVVAVESPQLEVQVASVPAEDQRFVSNRLVIHFEPIETKGFTLAQAFVQLVAHDHHIDVAVGP